MEALTADSLQLRQKFDKFKELARINLDLLFLSVDEKESPKARKELDKVKELVQAVTDGEENECALSSKHEKNKSSLSDTEFLDHYLDTLIEAFKGKEMMDVFQQLLQRAIYRKLVSRCFSLNSLSPESLKKTTPQRSSKTKRKSRPRKMATRPNGSAIPTSRRNFAKDVTLIDGENREERESSMAKHIIVESNTSIKCEVLLNKNAIATTKGFGVNDEDGGEVNSIIKLEPVAETMTDEGQAGGEEVDCKFNIVEANTLRRTPKPKALPGLCERSVSITQLRKMRTQNLLKEFGIPTDIFNSESKDPFVCPICRKLYGGKPSFLAHLRVHRSEKDGTKQTPEPQLCMICGKTMKNIASLKSHLKLHSAKENGEYLKCSKCGKEFLGEKRLRLHLSMYCHDSRSHLCDLCGKSYKTKYALEFHRRSLHSNSSTKPETCKTCGKGFSNWSNLLRHMRIHRGELPYSCSICEKKFRSNYNRKAHEKLHTGNFPYHCSLCDHGFLAPSHLRKHNRTYHPTEGEGETVKVMRKSNRRLYARGATTAQLSIDKERVKRRGKCDICGKEFNNLSNLKRHRFTHTGAKPHKCSMCHRSFGTKTILKKHMWTHSEVKQFPCDKCDKGFSDKRNLVSHMKKAHPEQPTAISTVSPEIPMPITMVTTTAMVHPDPSLEDAFLPYRPISFQIQM